jgi:hypothetical protein
MRNKLHQGNNLDVKKILDTKENKKYNLGLAEFKMAHKLSSALAGYPESVAE